MIENPFITYGYESPEYFCDREAEAEQLMSLLVNGNHTALISPRRMGKTGLIRHCFANPRLSEHYYTFLIDNSCKWSHRCAQAFLLMDRVMPVGILALVTSNLQFSRWKRFSVIFSQRRGHV